MLLTHSISVQQFSYPTQQNYQKVEDYKEIKKENKKEKPWWEQ